MQWVIDLVGPMPTAPANKEMMIVATDYFTKWIEAEDLSSNKEADVEWFIWKNIICRFDCSQAIVIDKVHSSWAGRPPYSLRSMTSNNTCQLPDTRKAMAKQRHPTRSCWTV
ncbi:unnamed protein product [Prunus armeniaca]